MKKSIIAWMLLGWLSLQGTQGEETDKSLDSVINLCRRISLDGNAMPRQNRFVINHVMNGSPLIITIQARFKNGRQDEVTTTVSEPMEPQTPATVR